MNDIVLKNAIGSLDKLLSSAKGPLWDIERELFGGSGFGDAGGYANPRAAMASSLAELHDVLVVVLEAAGMPETRASLIDAWRQFARGSGLTHTTADQELAWILSRLEAMLSQCGTSVVQE